MIEIINSPAQTVSALPVQHPRKTIVTAFPAGGRRTRKYDGCFRTGTISGCTVLMERVTNKSGAFLTSEDGVLLAKYGVFNAVFDMVTDASGGISHLPTVSRVALLKSIERYFPAGTILAETVTESAESVIARGGEGVCWQDWSAPYGEMQVIKAASIYVCRVTSRSTGQSVFIADATTGEARGAVALRGGKCDQVRVGSVIRVEGMGLTDAGKIRQPNPCREWLVTY